MSNEAEDISKTGARPGIGPLLATSRPSAIPGEDAEDLVLARRCQKGDKHAYSLLVARHQARIYSVVYKILPAGVSSDDADDLVQDIFVQVWRALPKYRGDAKFSTWMYRIATNMAIKKWHKVNRSQKYVADEELPEDVGQMLADPAPGPAGELDLKARDKELHDAIEQLPEMHRTVVKLHYFEGVSCEDTADMLGCNVGTIWSRLFYACKKLKENLGALES